ncbi:MAG TPA: hypothetical protein VGK14_13580 [Novimethylophilus sp.]|jgi:hypothetical protein|uniref:hypothetical protein n=1 Tax=Novimethylophilus sp. TaxID=2137426 RepID=UPI002F42AC69
MAQPKRSISPGSIPDGHYVQLDDFLFELHGLGPRFGLIHSAGGASYVCLGEVETVFDKLDPNTPIADLGDFDRIADLSPLTVSIIDTCIKRYKGFPDSQIVALALIWSKTDPVDASDELGLYRLTQWAKTYRARACWIARNKQLAYSKTTIDWQALRL